MEGKNFTLLIVDDEEELLEIYQDLFDSECFKVLVANSAEKALELYDRHRNVDLIISDANMSGMSGINFLDTLKSKYMTTPIFYLATGNINQSEEDFKKMGGSRLLLKPFDLDKVLAYIKIDLKL